MKGKLFCLIGVSGVGKTEARKYCVDSIASLQYLPSYTTRLPRPNEENGKDYFFISQNEFEKLIKEKGFIEWENHFGNYYGISKELFLNNIDSGVSLIKEIAIGGYEQILNSCDQNDIYSIYIQPDNISDVVDRINLRGDKDLSIRIDSFEMELTNQDICDRIIISEHGKLESLCAKIKDIIEEVLHSAKPS